MVVQTFFFFFSSLFPWSGRGPRGLEIDISKKMEGSTVISRSSYWFLSQCYSTQIDPLIIM